ncbi:hypothetical protein [Lysinibacillus sp. NPDC056185]|uniref:hypothetical protein n=1 Tax=Lysinibacillus sp. NPDC056185 TaxID=3345739 RepID=UPI0039EF539B
MKKSQFLTIASFSLLLFACGNDQVAEKPKKNEEIETVVTHGSYIAYDAESQLFNDAELVVMAKTDKKFEDREHVVKYISSNNESDAGLPPVIEDFYTKTPITISKLLKQDESSSITENDNLTIIEPISYDEQKKLSIENYAELTDGEMYILYLKKNTFGEYSIINMNNGRFNLESNDKIQSISEHGHEIDKEKHEEMKSDVVKRFANEMEEIGIDPQN